MKSEPGVPNVALPAVPLPESVARSLSSTGAPFRAPSQQQLQPHHHQQPPGPVAVGVPVSSVAPAPAAAAASAAVAPAPAPKPLYRPFSLSPPPSAKSSAPSAVSAPPHSTAVAAPYIPTSHPSTTNHHPAYRPFDPYYPASSLGYNPHYPAHTVSNPTGAPPTPYNGLLPSTKTTAPSTLGTHTVPSSHSDLTCKSHLPKLAHALTTSSPRITPTTHNPPHTHHTHQIHQAHHFPKSIYPSLPVNDPAALRREADQRYLHERNLAGALRPPHYMGSADVTNNPLAASVPGSNLLSPHHRPASNQSPSFLSHFVSLLIFVCKVVDLRANFGTWTLSSYCCFNFKICSETTTVLENLVDRLTSFSVHYCLQKITFPSISDHLDDSKRTIFTFDTYRQNLKIYLFLTHENGQIFKFCQWILRTNFLTILVNLGSNDQF